jgi:hypothetical protein
MKVPFILVWTNNDESIIEIVTSEIGFSELESTNRPQIVKVFFACKFEVYEIHKNPNKISFFIYNFSQSNTFFLKIKNPYTLET